MRKLLDEGFDRYLQAQIINFLGGKQQDGVSCLSVEKAGAGVVYMGMLKRIATKKLIKSNDLYV